MKNPFRRQIRNHHEDRIALQIAARYGMTGEYKTARRHGHTPLEALEDWDMVRQEERHLFL